MRIQVALLVLTVPLVNGCKVKSSSNPYKITVKPIEFKIPKIDLNFDDIKLDFAVCDKVEKNVSADLERNAINIHGFSEKQDTEYTDCEGKKTLKAKEAFNNFKDDLTIEASQGLSGKVEFADIENTRTCTNERVTFDAKKTFADVKSRDWILSPAWMNEAGAIVVGLNNSKSKFAIGLNVAKGQNILNITYYSKCLEKSETGYCKKGEVVGKKSVLVNADIEDRELNGIRSKDSCDDKSKKKKQQ